MKITSSVEGIFAQAVALEQAGILRNLIYVIGSEVFIINYDHTIIMRFTLRAEEPPFQFPIAFAANDYESNEFEEEEGKIVFITKQDGFEKRKTCSVPKNSSQDVKAVFEKLKNGLVEPSMVSIFFSREIVSLLERNLSHIEFTGKRNKTVKLTQRNVYSGALTTIEPEKAGLIQDTLPSSIEPMGIRTNDFVALFNFKPSWQFFFYKKGKGDLVYFKARAQTRNNKSDYHRNVDGFLSGCIYDELIAIKEVTNGGQK